jgi:hypothetical protein
MWATQYTPNNDQSNHPGILHDGRTFTDYSQNSTRNEQIKRENHLKSNEDYRKFLVKNADTIMQYNYEHSIHKNQTEYFPSVQYGSPFLYKSMQDDSKPYGYEDSIPKQNYLSREQIDDKKRRLYKDNY